MKTASSIITSIAFCAAVTGCATGKKDVVVPHITYDNPAISAQCFSLKRQYDKNHEIIKKYAADYYYYREKGFMGGFLEKGQEIRNAADPYLTDQHNVLDAMKRQGCDTQGLYVRSLTRPLRPPHYE